MQYFKIHSHSSQRLVSSAEHAHKSVATALNMTGHLDAESASEPTRMHVTKVPKSLSSAVGPLSFASCHESQRPLNYTRTTAALMDGYEGAAYLDGCQGFFWPAA